VRRLVMAFAAPLVVSALAACSGDQCLVFDYAPPSALFTLADRDTGEPICDAAVTVSDMRPVIAHSERCEYELPGWADPQLGQTMILQVGGFADETVELPAPEEDECGEVQAPEPLAFQLSPDDATDE
jgi:hypothetical protein